MLSFKQFSILFFATLLPFLFYFFGKPELAGFDGYYFMDYACHGAQINTPPIALLFFSWLPCDFLIAKIVLFSCCFACVVFIALLGELFNQKHGWKAGLIAFLAPILFFTFIELENEQLAYPFLFASIYFFYRGKKWDKFISAGLLVFTGLGLWEGAAYMAVAFALTQPFFWIIGIPILAIWPGQFVSKMMPDNQVNENMMGRIMDTLFLGFFGLLNPLRKVLPQLLFFFAIAIFNAKFSILVVPFLAPCLLCLIEEPEKSLFWPKLSKIRLPGKIKAWLDKNFKKYVYLSVFCALISQGMICMQNSMPSQEQISAVKYVITLGGGQVQNDWSFGHWVAFYGGETNSHSNWMLQQSWHKGAILTSDWLPECEQRAHFSDANVYWCDVVPAGAKKED
jgi:hypothetical protein